MNKASSINNQFNSNNINNNNNNGSNRHLVTNGKNVNNLLYYGHEAPRIEQYKASPMRPPLNNCNHFRTTTNLLSTSS